MPATARWMALPTSVEPVNAILSMPSWSTMACPIEGPPARMLTVPAGRSASAMISASVNAVSGVVSAGLSTTVFPVARAGAIFQAAMSRGSSRG